jgi:hypothetical protein
MEEDYSDTIPIKEIDTIKSKLYHYLDSGISICFRLKNHQEYLFKGKIINVMNIEYEYLHDEFGNINKRTEGFSFILKLDNGELAYFTDRDIDYETIHPSSYNPVRIYMRQPIPETLKEEVMKRDNYICKIKLDGCTTKAECCDHIIPWSLGGETTLNNLQASCNNCNLKKSNKIIY